MNPSVTFLVPDISSPVLGPVTELARHVATFAPVQVVGPDIGYGVCPMYRDAFPFTVVPTPRLYRFPEFLREARKIADAVTGEIVVAVKAAADTVPVAWWLRRRRRAKMVVYLDEWDGALMQQRSAGGRLRRWLAHGHHPLDDIYYPWVERLIPGADLVLSTNTALQRRFGGHVVPMGVDTEYFAPRGGEAARLRKAALGLADCRLVVFGGVVRPHKGVDVILDALARLGDPRLRLLVVGPENEHVRALQADARLGSFLTCTGARPKAEMPDYLDLADLFVLPLEDTPLARTQTPCKVFEAMAMAKPVVATRISDLPLILDGCGALVPPGDADALAAEIRRIVDDPAGAAAMGRRARERCREHYSSAVTRQLLERHFSGLMAGRASSKVTAL